jgi:hypothetical protein
MPPAPRLSQAGSSAFEQNGFTTHEAWERVRKEYLFPPEELALKAKNDR